MAAKAATVPATAPPTVAPERPVELDEFELVEAAEGDIVDEGALESRHEESEVAKTFGDVRSDPINQACTIPRKHGGKTHLYSIRDAARPACRILHDEYDFGACGNIDSPVEGRRGTLWRMNGKGSSTRYNSLRRQNTQLAIIAAG